MTKLPAVFTPSLLTRFEEVCVGSTHEVASFFLALDADGPISKPQFVVHLRCLRRPGVLHAVYWDRLEEQEEFDMVDYLARCLAALEEYDGAKRSEAAGYN